MVVTAVAETGISHVEEEVMMVGVAVLPEVDLHGMIGLVLPEVVIGMVIGIAEDLLLEALRTGGGTDLLQEGLTTGGETDHRVGRGEDMTDQAREEDQTLAAGSLFARLNNSEEYMNAIQV